MPRLDMVDTSNNNGTMTVANWRSMKKYGVRAMVAKLSEGTFFTDQTAKTSIRNAVTAGLHVNGYHFARFTTVAGAKAEARMAAHCAFNAGLGKDAVIVLDFEATNLGWNRNAANIKAWIAEVKRMGYPKTDVYTMGSWTNSLPLNNSGRGGWIANYPSNPTGLKFYASYRGWQWTSTKHFPGCYGGFDVSQMYSSYYYGSSTTKKDKVKSKKEIYYQYNPGTVYARTVIKRYKDKAFKHVVDSWASGTVFEVAKLVKYGKITRFQLANGLYITSNGSNVNRLYYSTTGGVKQVKSARGTHRYTDLALHHVKDWLPAGTVFDVASVVKHGDTTRIKLGNGLYISGNKKINSFVK
ncbi:GH25 family lysozyme [Levilactobacillus spicheri]|uniref:Lyzozyme M1 (1,4-beta-N-acetylmuramidase) n=1 Tax=Levilactobacillus spicheri TaxID=216463 RepID=A0A0F3RU59_9LACO|nr:GH25 family lysozyme [Levilactobacillus spicheri]KJW12885.1 Lyzozyme M1 (1,4-beta-N-acetylmuramidase) [Levilactobacillus spicheri]KJW13568.1 Lyzozyme M1 (1,4-beta-N-acetylmuramidase) [Levilactobacillus spicheri]